MHPPIILAIPLIVSIFLSTCPAEAIADASLLNLKPILDELTPIRSSNIESRNKPIHLHGQYHVLEYVMRSLNISIIGGQSTSIVSSRTGNEPALSNSNPSPMLIVSNSTVALSSLRLICNRDHSSVATIRQSSLSVSNCKIGAASSTSPFISTWTPTDNSILIVIETQVNWKYATSLPLFGTMPRSHKSLVTESSEDSLLGRETDQTRGILSIVGSGLSFSNTALPLATGPLFDFGFNKDNIQQSLLTASVCLTRSVMTNVTSRHRFIPDTLRFPLVSQRVICSSISESTNHLYGTGSLDMNFGTSVCCMNSSFSKCETDPDPTEGPPTVYLQHFTTQFDHKLSPECTLFDTCTFRDIHAERGSAIDSNQATATLSVTKCSFLRCSAKSEGGSICFHPYSTSSVPATVSHCSFVSGQSGFHAGAILFTNCQQGSITDCVFYDLYAKINGGGLVLLDCQPGEVTVSNCLFQKCSQNTSFGFGGAVYVQNAGFRFTSLRFRKNLAYAPHRAQDVAIRNSMQSSDSPPFTDCDTDQDPIFVCFDHTPPIPPDFVTASTPLAVSSVGSIVSSDTRTVKATLTVDKPISGTVLVLVDNTDNYEMPNDESPPPLSRMISFDFTPDSTSAESTLSFGEWEVLQYEANYSLVTFGWKESIVDTNGAILTTPNPPRIVRAMCEGGNSEFDAFFSLKARTLATGSYKASVKGNSDFWMFVDFVSNPSGGNIFSTKIGLKLQGEKAILAFETTYEIEKVIEVSTGETLILDPPRLFFTTPTSPILKSVGSISFSDSKKDTITIKLVGEKLMTNPYKLTVTDGSTTSTLTAEFDADGVNGEATAVLYSMDDSTTVQLGFGMTYTITDFTCSRNPQLTLTPNLQIVVPSEPARVEKVVSAALNDAQNGVEVTFQARALPATITSVTITGKDASAFISATRLSVTSFSALFTVAETASATSLVFGELYSIESVSSGSDFLISDDVILMVPLASRIESVGTLSLHKMRTEVTIPLMGVALSNKPMLVTVERNGVVITSTQTIEFVTETEVTIVFAAGLSESTSNLEFGQTYTVKSVKNETASFIVNPSISFMVPSPPVVTLITPSLSSKI
ncbi:hypothetical protein BLNAU_2092 [Blattamonas nauphoetae]|uniref:Right handed beta helix domain-containing protein n=1 Tax=Blattamonas nauphoetae TaxID=2049346 RepID=A0ABQ9YH28_9EUKA|nr:hypothetical protein BLNAU_2092 [Blattamonas nauphoetae]